MREIKFRVWQEMMGKWEMSYTPYLYESDGKPHDYSGIVNLNQEIQNELPINDILMQYVGLKDKKDKEIYEGDIISYKYFKGFSELEQEIIAKVEFIEGCFGFYEYKREDDDYFNKYDLSNTVVIGNIYENPELLEV